jgi:FtsZ-binding cell division protein ZapB
MALFGIKIKRALIFFLLITFLGQGNVFGNEDEWVDDLDKKIDQTIEVLDVVKGELKELKEDEKEWQQAMAADENGNWVEVLRARVRIIAKIWKKLRKYIAEESETLRSAAKGQKEPGWAKELSGRLDQTMKAMEVIKEELKEIEKQE